MSSVALALAMLGWAAGANAQAERTSRDSWQRVDDIFAALEVKEGDRIADVGAGSGFFTFRLSPKVGPSGSVIAEDVNRRALEGLREAAERGGFSNVETILGEADDPKLPEGSLDGVLIVNAYHEMYEHEAMLAGIRRALRPGGRLVIVEMPRDSTLSRRRQMGEHGLTIGIVVQDLVASGFEVVAKDPDFVRSGRNRQWIVVAVVPETAGAPPRYDGARL
jgi:ubiquinone/menaquinone biosynthesis C-methylase UbiE